VGFFIVDSYLFWPCESACELASEQVTERYIKSRRVIFSFHTQKSKPRLRIEIPYLCSTAISILLVPRLIDSAFFTTAFYTSSARATFVTWSRK
jgi:hypothetical protein